MIIQSAKRVQCIMEVKALGGNQIDRHVFCYLRLFLYMAIIFLLDMTCLIASLNLYSEVYWYSESENVSHSAISDFCNPMDCMQPTRLLYSRDSPGKNTGMGKPFPSPGDLPSPGMEPRSPALQADSLLSEPPGKPIYLICY